MSFNDRRIAYEGGTGLGWSVGSSTLSVPEVTCGAPHSRFNDGREEKCIIGFSWSQNF